MQTCYLGLGSNLGDSRQIFRSFLNDFSQEEHIDLINVSSCYLSKPMADKNQPDYLNAVICINTDLSPHELLDLLHKYESLYGRVRTGVHWDARTIDLDILLYGQLQLNETDLVIPHYGISEREFVLYPLSEIAPQLNIPGLGAISALLSCCDKRGMIKLNDNDCDIKTAKIER